VSAIRLQRVLAASGVASRRGADALIEAGRVTVDGRTATLGDRVDSERQRIEVDGKRLEGPQAPVYLALCKPAGITSTTADPHAARTVLDLVPHEVSRGSRLYPVGRLDRDSEGLLLLTNDGAFADRVLHPRYGVEREYAVAVRTPLAGSALAALRRGVQLSDGRAAVRSIREASGPELDELAGTFGEPVRPWSWYRVVLGEGRKREVRRLFTAVGSPVERLIRVRIGPLEVDGLRPGRVRRLTADEVAALHETAVAAADG
jgi:23S rRNA pseudouridine2605 synthase